MAKLPPPLPGTDIGDYERVPGKAGRYRLIDDPDFQISRRSHDTLRLSHIGWFSSAERDKDRQSLSYQRWRDAARAQGIGDNKFDREYLKVKRAGFPKQKGFIFDDFLTSLGFRDPDADYNVGSTPKRKR